MPPRATPPVAWLTSLTTRTGWVAPATGMGKWGVGAKPRPQTPTPRLCVLPVYGTSRMIVSEYM